MSKVSQGDCFDIKEPIRKSVFDVVIANLKLAGHKTFLHRYIYCGQFENTPEKPHICDLIKSVVVEINSDYNHEILTGFMLYATKHFVVLVEGSEDIIIKHFIKFFEEGAEIIGPAKLIISVHHINRRFYDVFDCITMDPPVLLKKIDPDLNFEDTKIQLQNVLKKLQNLAIQLRYEREGKPTILGEITKEMQLLLPESEVIDFLILSKYPLNIREMIPTFNVVPPCDFAVSEKIWPVRNDFVPYDIFEKERNYVPYLPGFKIEKIY